MFLSRKGKSLLITFDVFKYYKTKDANTIEESLLITFDVFKYYKIKDAATR